MKAIVALFGALALSGCGSQASLYDACYSPTPEKLSKISSSEAPPGCSYACYNNRIVYTCD